MITYRVVALYSDAEIAEGFGHTKADAKADVVEQIPFIYPMDDVTFETHED